MDIEHFCEKDVRRIVFWGKMVGSVLSLYGILVSVQALLSSPVGILPGITAFFGGSFIFASGEHAKRLILSNGKDSLEVQHLVKFIGNSFLSIGIILCMFILSYGIYLMTA